MLAAGMSCLSSMRRGGPTTTSASSEPLLTAELPSRAIRSNANPKSGPINHELYGGNDWVRLPRGTMGYKKSFIRDKIRVLLDGSENMGMHVIVPGEGCRQLESEGMIKDWPEYINMILDAGGEFARLDLALDDKSGILNLNEIKHALDDGCLVSRYRKARKYVEQDIHTGKITSETFYIGSSKSDSQNR